MGCALDGKPRPARAVALKSNSRSFVCRVAVAPPARLVSLKMICGPGDEGEPVITIMQP